MLSTARRFRQLGLQGATTNLFESWLRQTSREAVSTAWLKGGPGTGKTGSGGSDLIRRFTRVSALLCAFAAAAVGPASSQTSADWKVQAGKSFQRAGEYTLRLRNTRFQDAIAAWGEPGSCRVVGSSNHAIATWPDRGIRVELWTYGGMPDGENGCISPDLIYVSEIRLTDRRWTTAFGLRVGDPTTKLRRLYPRAQYQYGPDRGTRRAG